MLAYKFVESFHPRVSIKDQHTSQEMGIVLNNNQEPFEIILCKKNVTMPALIVQYLAALTHILNRE